MHGVMHVPPPCSEYVAVIQRYVETRSRLGYGLVTHATAAALRGFLDDWLLYVTQLEHQWRMGRLNMQVGQGLGHGLSCITQPDPQWNDGKADRASRSKDLS